MVRILNGKTALVTMLVNNAGGGPVANIDAKTPEVGGMTL